MYFCGAKMVDMTGLGPVLDGMALNNGIGSYGDRVIFCFTADRDAMPDPEFYEDCIAGAVDELVAATKGREEMTETRARRKMASPPSSAAAAPWRSGSVPASSWH